MSKTYNISEETLRNLIKSNMTLNALNYGGVENSKFFDNSIKEYLDIASSIYGFEIRDLSELVEYAMKNFCEKK